MGGEMNRRRLAAGLPGQVVPEKPDAGVAADLKEFGVAGEWPNVQLSELSDFLTGFPFRFPWTDSLMGSLNCLIARLGKETISDRLYLRCDATQFGILTRNSRGYEHKDASRHQKNHLGIVLAFSQRLWLRVVGRIHVCPWAPVDKR
jgi:hypothetical protein